VSGGLFIRQDRPRIVGAHAEAFPRGKPGISQAARGCRTIARSFIRGNGGFVPGQGFAEFSRRPRDVPPGAIAVGQAENGFAVPVYGFGPVYKNSGLRNIALAAHDRVGK